MKTLFSYYLCCDGMIYHYLQYDNEILLKNNNNELIHKQEISDLSYHVEQIEVLLEQAEEKGIVRMMYKVGV